MKKFQLENPSNSQVFINFKCEEEPVKFNYPNKKSNFKGVMRTFSRPLSAGLVVIFMASLVLSGLFANVLITVISMAVWTTFSIIIILLFTKNKKLVKMIPKINRYLSHEIKQKVVTELDSLEFEIPIFDNVYLGYEAIKDFSKYLEKIEVVEHDFDIIEKSWFGIKKKERNDFYWKAKFIFSKIPKKGELKVEFI